MAHSIALIGIGKIAQDQHLPVIAADPDFRLAAVVSQRGFQQPGVPTFRTAAELYRAIPDLDAVAICTPPGPRYDHTREALLAGKHVLLEKPPFPTTAELGEVARLAGAQGRVIFTTWHSQYNAAVDDLTERLAGQRLRRLHITWKEDVRRWHPGQDWIWEPGGFGVFDPGINALSILTRILPQPAFVRAATLTTPSNRQTPIAVDLVFGSAAMVDGGTLTAAFDWRQQGDQTWDIDVDTADGDRFALRLGGSQLALNGTVIREAPSQEYQAIYRRFAGLLQSGESMVDAAPFQLVADAFMVGRRVETAPFE